MNILKTDRLILRPFRLDDVDAVHAFGSNPEVVRYMLFGPNTYTESIDFINKIVSQYYKENPITHYEYAIELGGEVIGAVSLHLKGDLSYGSMGWILNRSYHFRGFATEAARCLMNYGFESLGLKKIYAICDSNNLASEKVMKRLGMKLVRIEKNVTTERKAGLYIRDQLVYEIKKDEYIL